MTIGVARRSTGCNEGATSTRSPMSWPAVSVFLRPRDGPAPPLQRKRTTSTRTLMKTAVPRTRSARCCYRSRSTAAHRPCSTRESTLRPRFPPARTNRGSRTMPVRGRCHGGGIRCGLRAGAELPADLTERAVLFERGSRPLIMHLKRHARAAQPALYIELNHVADPIHGRVPRRCPSLSQPPCHRGAGPRACHERFRSRR